MVCELYGLRTQCSADCMVFELFWSADGMVWGLFGLRTVWSDRQFLSITSHDMKAWLAWSENCHCLQTAFSADCLVRTAGSSDRMVFVLYDL